MSPYPVPREAAETAGLARVAAQIEALRGEIIPRLERIERQVERTNGRVTTLELHDAHEEGAAAARDAAHEEIGRRRRRTDDRRWSLRILTLTVAGSILSGVTVALILLALPA
ncbi:MAG: hypothetical protein RIB67_07430 [Miltoncostaeaceae bacterium]